MILAVCAFFVAYVLRFNFELDAVRVETLDYQTLLYSLVFLVSYLIVRPYIGINRHTSMYDAMKVMVSVSLALLILLAINGFIYFSGSQMPYYFPLSILLIAYLTTLFLLLSLRMMVKIFYMWMIQTPDLSRHVLIYGAEDMGMTTRRTIESKAKSELRVVGRIIKQRWLKQGLKRVFLQNHSGPVVVKLITADSYITATAVIQ